ncbi:hypothetical protein AX16_002105 [Volvariella volvacea WC 439]|nr:hypothetical protein AX16_002105 [Volvariella volvacea WC 439]
MSRPKLPSNVLNPRRPIRPIREGCSCPYCISQPGTEIPDWWDLLPNEKANTLERLWLFLVRYSLCLVAYGRTNMDEIWFHVQPGHREEWEACLQRLNQRLGNQNIVGGLLLATTAVFITTEPPKPAIVQYTTDFSYLFLLGSFAMSVGSILSGSAIQFVLTHLPADWFCHNLCTSRTRIILTMWVLCYPLLSVAISATICAIGVILGAVSTKDNTLVIGCFIVLVLPVSLLFIFVGMAIFPSARGEWYNKYNDDFEALQPGASEQIENSKSK